MQLLCSGPGPHDPADGVLGEADQPIAGMLCPPCTAAAQATELLAQQAQDQVDAAVAVAQQGVDELHGQVPSLRDQLAADIALVSGGGWDALDGQLRTAIILRVLEGFGTAMAGLVDHAIVTGAVSPI